MDHDHDHHESLGCDKKGLMSYGNSLPDEWSDCSVHDFEKWWRTVGVACDLVQAQYPGKYESNIIHIMLQNLRFRQNMYRPDVRWLHCRLICVYIENNKLYPSNLIIQLG